MNKLSILIFDGSEKKSTFINRLINGLVQRGHKVTVAEFHSDKKNRITGATYINLGSQRKKIKLIVNSGKLLLQTLFKTSSYSRFSNLISGFVKFDINSIRKVNLFNAILKTKADVVHLQWLSLLPFCEELLDKGLTKFVLSQRGTHINVRPFIDEDNYNYLRKIFAKIDGFHSVSKAMKQKSKLIYSDDNKIDEVVYSGLNINNIDFNTEYSKGETIKLLSVGRPHWIKGYTTMMQVCKELANRNLDFNYTIIGANKNNEELLYLISQNNLSDRVHLKSKISQEEVFQLMRSSSALVLPSLEEGIANVVIEAMAIGLPVISTNCGGMAELVEDNKSGYLVPVNNKKALADAIIKFSKEDPEKINVLKRNARQKVEVQHNTSKMVEDMEKLYYKCLS